LAFAHVMPRIVKHPPTFETTILRRGNMRRTRHQAQITNVGTPTMLAGGILAALVPQHWSTIHQQKTFGARLMKFIQFGTKLSWPLFCRLIGAPTLETQKFFLGRR